MPALAALALGAWGTLVAGDLLGYAWLVQHDVLFETGTVPLVIALPLFLAAWQLMTAAMMLPTALPTVGLFSRASRSRGATTAFVGAYFAVWTAFAVAALAGDKCVHTVVDLWPWLDAHPHIVTGGVLATAGVGQLTGLTERCLDVCRNPLHLLLRYYDRGVGPAWRLGLRHAAFCVGCCWPLMLVAFGLGTGSLVLMLALAAVMLVTKTMRNGRRIMRPIGYVLIAGGVLLVATTLAQ
jgi:predicted metal-binding membrane protein